jgi:hypothetical protein
MRRLARYTFHLTAALSLVLCLAACVLWVRSHEHRDDITKRWADPQGPAYRFRAMQSAGGSLSYTSSDQLVPADEFARREEFDRQVVRNYEARHKVRPRRGDGWRWTTSRGRTVHQYQSAGFPRRLGFEADVVHRQLSDSPPMSMRATYLRMPHWFLALLTAAPPAAWVVRRWRARARRRAAGLCRSCGYDLRASRERCPECGAETVRAKGVA